MPGFAHSLFAAPPPEAAASTPSSPRCASCSSPASSTSCSASCSASASRLQMKRLHAGERRRPRRSARPGSTLRRLAFLLADRPRPRDAALDGRRARRLRGARLRAARAARVPAIGAAGAARGLPGVARPRRTSSRARCSSRSRPRPSPPSSTSSSKPRTTSRSATARSSTTRCARRRASSPGLHARRSACSPYAALLRADGDRHPRRLLPRPARLARSGPLARRCPLRARALGRAGDRPVAGVVVAGCSALGRPEPATSALAFVSRARSAARRCRLLRVDVLRSLGDGRELPRGCARSPLRRPDAAQQLPAADAAGDRSSSTAGAWASGARPAPPPKRSLALALFMRRPAAAQRAAGSRAFATGRSNPLAPLHLRRGGALRREGRSARARRTSVRRTAGSCAQVLITTSSSANSLGERARCLSPTVCAEPTKALARASARGPAASAASKPRAAIDVGRLQRAEHAAAAIDAPAVARRAPGAPLPRRSSAASAQMHSVACGSGWRSLGW